MGFLDKVKETANKIKEENRNLGKTTGRINNDKEFVGEVNRGIKEGDFWEGSYLSIESGKGVIYGSSQDDYVFATSDVAECKEMGPGKIISQGNFKYASLRFVLTFKDGKTAQVDVLSESPDKCVLQGVPNTKIQYKNKVADFRALVG